MYKLQEKISPNTKRANGKAVGSLGMARKKISKKHFAYNGWPMHGNLLHILFIFFRLVPFFSQQILIICDSSVRSLLSFLLQSIELLEPTRRKKTIVKCVCAFNLSVLFVMAIQTIAFEPIKNDSTCNDMDKIIFRRAH